MTAAVDVAPAYRHEALFWSDEAQFIATAAAFVADGVVAGEPVMVALPHPRLERLREALGLVAAEVDLVQMTELGRNPARILPAWGAFVEKHAGRGRPLRGIGEPIWTGRRDEEVHEGLLHEALLNLAVPETTPLWLLCPYDVGRLSPDVVAEARRTHPVVSGETARGPQAAYRGAARVADLFTVDLPALPAPAIELAFTWATLHDVHEAVLAAAARTALPFDRAADLSLAAHEVATNSVTHGFGGGVLRIWFQSDALVCEVRDRGRIRDPLAGRRAPSEQGTSGRGLWMTNQLCDLVQVRSHAEGTTVRIHTWI